jgi:4-amino-4-deoxy-L-arabinose transferase-like glycosyltransferase
MARRAWGLVQPDAQDRRPGLWLALAVALTLGALLPALLYFARPSLLLDEVRLALNIGARSWVGLTRPLDYDQTAPLLFLWVAKLATRLGGVNEYTLRAVPFAAAVAIPPLLWLLGRRLVGDAGAVMAAALAALSPLVLQYGRQVKPYTLDAVVALVLLWLGLNWLDAPEDQRHVRRLAVVGTFAPWVSMAAAFVLAGLLAVVATVPRPRRPSGRLLVLLVVAWGASLALAYTWIYRPAAENPYMTQFWRASLLAIGEPGFFARLWQGTRELFWQTFVGGTTEPGVAPLLDELANPAASALLAVWLLGLWRAGQWSGRRRWALVVAPLGVTLAASCVGKYPVAARTMLFAVPVLALGVAAGWLALLRGVAPRARAALGPLAAACLLGPPLVLDSHLVIHRRAFENVREAVREYERRRAPGESIYVFAAALPAWTFYTTDWRHPDQARLARMARLGSFGGPAFENAPPRAHAIGVEGDSLTYPLGDAREIVGLYHGAQGRSAASLAQNSPDTNWTTNEARRIRNAATPSVWVLTIRTLGLERFLYDASGLCLDRLYQRDGFALARLSVAPVCRRPAEKAAG